MTLQPIVPARPRPARCAELSDAHRPTRPIAARRGRLRPSHNAITAELLDLTWQFLTHAAPTVRAQLGQFHADHGQHPVAGLGVTIPLQVLLQWDDEGNDRQVALELFDAFGSQEKTLHANMGGHTGVPQFEGDVRNRFLARHLT